MNKYKKLLQQLNNEEVAKALPELYDRVDDNVAFTKYIDDVIHKTSASGQGAPFLAKDFMSMLLGEKALQDVEDLAVLPGTKKFEKIRDISYKGLPEVRDSLNSKILPDFASIKNEITLNPEHKNFGSSNSSGISISDNPDIPLSKKIGTGFHEYGHNLDDAFRVAQIKLNFLSKMDTSNPDVKREINEVVTALRHMKANYPGQLDKFFKAPKGVSESVPVKRESLDLFLNDTDSPVEQYKELSKGHHFNRNFEFDNLKNILKNGLKSVKGVGVGMIPAVGLAALASYSPEGMAKDTVETAQRAIEEGDPSSMLFPSGLNENEDEQIKNIQEQQMQANPNLRRWDKIRKILYK